MTTTERLDLNRFKGLVIFALFLTLVAKSCTVSAQGWRPKQYKGIEAVTGVKLFTLSSDNKKLDKLQVVEEGGTAGFIFGNEVFRTTINVAGLYYSSNGTRQEVNMYSSGFAFSFFPVQLSKFTTETKLEPYVKTGASYNILTFRGHLGTEDVPQTNYSASEQPFFGRVNQTTANIGVGMSWNILERYDFVQMIAEVNYGFSLTHGGSKVLANTSFSDVTTIVVGVRFGAHR